MKQVGCCSTLNDSYLPGFLVFFHTLKKYTPSFNLPYYILTWGELSPKSVDTLNRLYPKFVIVNIQNEVYEGWQANTRWRKWHINCINRYDAFIIENLDRVIFFDIDMLVTSDISGLLEAEPDFGAVEIFPKSILVDHPECYNKTLKSFNGGVMSISKKYLNKETRQKLIDVAFQRSWTSDEPILNTVFTNEMTTFLPQAYNTLTQALTNDEIYNNAKIIHFLGLKKPWFSGTFLQRFDGDVIQRSGGYSLIRKLDALYQREYNEVKHLL